MEMSRKDSTPPDSSSKVNSMLGVLSVEEHQEKRDMGLLSEQQETVINVAFVQDRFELNWTGIQPYSFKMT